MRLLIALVLAIGGSAAASPSVSNHASARPPAQIEPVETVALRLARAAFAGDHATELALTLTWAELSAISERTDERRKELWDGEVKELFDRLEDEGRLRPVKVVRSSVVKSGTLRATPGERLKRDVDYAIIELVTDDGTGSTRRRHPMIFLRTANGWRFSPHQ